MLWIIGTSFATTTWTGSQNYACHAFPLLLSISWDTINENVFSHRRVNLLMVCYSCRVGYIDRGNIAGWFWWIGGCSRSTQNLQGYSQETLNKFHATNLNFVCIDNRPNNVGSRKDVSEALIARDAKLTWYHSRVRQAGNCGSNVRLRTRIHHSRTPLWVWEIPRTCRG